MTERKQPHAIELKHSMLGNIQAFLALTLLSDNNNAYEPFWARLHISSKDTMKVY